MRTQTTARSICKVLRKPALVKARRNGKLPGAICISSRRGFSRLKVPLGPRIAEIQHATTVEIEVTGPERNVQESVLTDRWIRLEAVRVRLVEVELRPVYADDIRAEPATPSGCS